MDRSRTMPSVQQLSGYMLAILLGRRSSTTGETGGRHADCRSANCGRGRWTCCRASASYRSVRSRCSSSTCSRRFSRSRIRAASSGSGRGRGRGRRIGGHDVLSQCSMLRWCTSGTRIGWMRSIKSAPSCFKGYVWIRTTREMGDRWRNRQV